MGTYIHIAEVAVLLFVAYVAGWLIGYAAKRIAAGPRETAVAIPSERLAAATGDAQPADALVKAPVVVPVTAASPPPTPAMAAALEPVKARVTNDGEVLVDANPVVAAAPVTPTEPVSGIDTLKSLSATMPLMPSEDAPAIEEMVEAKQESATPPATPTEPAPAAVAAGDVTTAAEVAAARAEIIESLTPAAEPVHPERVQPEAMAANPAPAAPAAEPVAISPVEPEPAPAPAPAVPAMPASAPGVAWAGAINGHEAAKFEPAATVVEPIAVSPPPAPIDTPFTPAALHDDLPPALPDADDEPSAGLDVAVLGSMADELKVDAPSPEPVDVAPAPEPQPIAVEPPAEPVAIAVAPQPEPQAPAAPAHVEFDESAAMRAIEGGWSRRASRALPDAPEMTDVSAAVSAAQVAVEQVLALNGLDVAEAETRAQAAFGKPRGLSKPRDGGRDDLKQINGLGPLDESTLNNLGIFHLDQIADWDEREVLWLENHAFARGRIGRERWQGQARELQGSGDVVRAARSRMPL